MIWTHPFIARRELILGGQKSGKTRRAEALAAAWLAADAAHAAVMIATAQPWDDEMRQRIARHQRERAQRVPGMATVEAPPDLPGAIAAHSRANTLLVIDCLTLWLTQQLMPATAASAAAASAAPGASKPLQNSQQKTGLRHVNPDDSAINTIAIAPTEPAPATAALLAAITAAPGPLVIVSNEIGLGVIPLGRETRAFVDALGALNQATAAVCERVTLMAAGLPLALKGGVF